ncbi:LITAF-like protein [Mya arenaria]|uniref:LITAF-like protein n=1 Tax=Mya arenaria TaxID=6604 RepID=A0ABY7EV52_MYAAR|nr:LITAF-like protein [Mya arenaria]
MLQYLQEEYQKAGEPGEGAVLKIGGGNHVRLAKHAAHAQGNLPEVLHDERLWLHVNRSRGRANGYRSVLVWKTNNPISVGAPPITVYVQPQAFVVQQFREVPLRMRCMFCQADVVTSTYFENGTITWLFVPLGCCLIPFCMEDMKDVVHRYPNCNQQAGRFNRM